MATCNKTRDDDVVSPDSIRSLRARVVLMLHLLVNTQLEARSAEMNEHEFLSHGGSLVPVHLSHASPPAKPVPKMTFSPPLLSLPILPMYSHNSSSSSSFHSAYSEPLPPPVQTDAEQYLNTEQYGNAEPSQPEKPVLHALLGSTLQTEEEEAPEFQDLETKYEPIFDDSVENVDPSTLDLTPLLESSTVGSVSQEAAQEAQVLQRIAELKEQGLWSPTSKKTSKALTDSRQTAHWDCLLEEMSVVADRIRNQRKLHISTSKKLAKAIIKNAKREQTKTVREEREQEQCLKRIASKYSRLVKNFWLQMEKVVLYKQHIRIQERRSEAMTKHLDFVVGQTEMLSQLLARVSYLFVTD